jgi:hypothetical protein
MLARAQALCTYLPIFRACESSCLAEPIADITLPRTYCITLVTELGHHYVGDYLLVSDVQQKHAIDHHIHLADA